jgi:endonuclease-8
MAEGDSVLRAARQIEAALGRRRVQVRTPNPRGAAAGLARLDGRLLERSESHGKNLLLRFEDSVVLHSHLGMSGAWHVYPLGARWHRGAGRAWAVLAGDSHEAVEFDGPTLRLLSAAQLRRDPFLARLGPDILGAEFSADGVLEWLRAADRGRELGDALLDQRLLAGIGNIFKSEACFAAGIDPTRPLEDLADEEVRRVIAAARELMQESAAGARRPLRVYRRSGAACPRCGARIRTARQGDASRSTFWCPGCQR